MGNPFLKRFREFILAPSHSRTISAVVILIIAAAIPLTVLVAQQQQETRQQAATICGGNDGAPRWQGSGCCQFTWRCNNGTTTCLQGSTACVSLCHARATCSTPHYNCNTTTKTCSATFTTPGVYADSASCNTACAGTTSPAPAPTATPTPVTTTPTPTPTTVPTGVQPPTSANNYGKAYQVCGTTFCGWSSCSNAGAAYPSYAVDCTYQSWNCSGNSCGAQYYNHYWSESCDLTYAQRLAGGTPNGRCTPPAPTGLNCVVNSAGTGYLLTWNSVPQTTYKVYSGSTLLQSPTTNSYTGPLSITSYTVKSNGGGRISLTGATKTCPARPTTCSISGQTNPYYTCGSNNTCIVNNACGANSGGCTSAGGSCGTASQIACSSISANPPTVSINGNSNLSISCTNTTANTTYTWTSNTCGNVVNVNSSSTSWTGPATGPATCPVSVNVCNGTSCSTGNVTIPVTIPDCNAGLQPTSACVATISNTCQANNGTQTAQYRTYNGSTICNPVNTTQTCTIPSCNVGNICTNGQCVAQTCSNGTTQCSSTGIPQTCTNGNWVNGNACTPGQVCTNGNCSVSPGNTYIAFTIGMDAIGSAGDNVNPNPSSSNQNPANTTRNLAVEIFNSNNNQVFAQIGSISYNSGPGVFKGTVDLGANFASGNYLVLVKSDGHLRRRIPGIQNLTSALPQPIQLQRVNLVTGDVDNNNVLNINDYNILLSCVTDPDVANIDNHALCNSNANYVKLSDLEDNNVINKFDYNLFLREYAVQNGD